MSANTVSNICQQIPKEADVKESTNGKATSGLMMASIMLLTESLMAKTECQNPSVQPVKKKQTRRGKNQGETSDEDGHLSTEESTIAGSPTLSCSAPSIDVEESDSDFEDTQHQTAFQSLKLVDESNVDGFYLVGRRLAGIFADLDDTDSDDGSDDLPRSDDEQLDVMQWQRVGNRLAKLAWLDMEDSDLEN